MDEIDVLHEFAFMLDELQSTYRDAVFLNSDHQKKFSDSVLKIREVVDDLYSMKKVTNGQ